MFQARRLIHICSDVIVQRFRRWLLQLSDVFFRLHVSYVREAGTEISVCASKSYT